MFIPGFILEDEDLKELYKKDIIKNKYTYKGSPDKLDYYSINGMGFRDLVGIIYSNKFFSGNDRIKTEFLLRNVCFIFTAIVNKKGALEVLPSINTLYHTAPTEANFLLSLISVDS